MLPMALLNLVVAAIWHYTAAWDFTTALLWRWLLCGLMIFVPYVVLGRGLTGTQKLTKRIYRFAD
jgi:NADH-quinone oxidoreductase subunit H